MVSCISLINIVYKYRCNDKHMTLSNTRQDKTRQDKLMSMNYKYIPDRTNGNSTASLFS